MSEAAFEASGDTLDGGSQSSIVQESATAASSLIGMKKGGLFGKSATQPVDTSVESPERKVIDGGVKNGANGNNGDYLSGHDRSASEQGTKKEDSVSENNALSRADNSSPVVADRVKEDEQVENSADKGDEESMEVDAPIISEKTEDDKAKDANEEDEPMTDSAIKNGEGNDEEVCVKKSVSMDTSGEEHNEISEGKIEESTEKEDVEVEQQKSPRKRGRPPKAATAMTRKAGDEKEKNVGRRSMRARKPEEAPVSTPRPQRGRRRSEHSSKEEEKNEDDDSEEKAPVTSPRRPGRPRKNESSTSTAEHRRKDGEESFYSNEAEEEEVVVPKKRPGRPRKSTSTAVTPVSAVKKTPGRGRGRPKIIRKEEEAGGDGGTYDNESLAVRRKGGAETSSASLVKREKKEEGEDDPFDVDTEFDKHPKPLNNITIEKGSFGEMKYARTPSSSKYEKTEQSASARVSSLTSFSSPSPNIARTLGSLSNRKSLGGSSCSRGSMSGNRRRGPKKAKDEGEEEDDEEEEKSISETMDLPQDDEESTPKDPSRGGRGRKRKTEESSAESSSAKRAEACVSIPELDAEAQWAADHPEDEDAPLIPGARVYAAFDKMFYPAQVGERDNLGRYLVRFIEDGVVRHVPSAGIIPLSAVVAEKECYVNGEEEPCQVRVVRSPNAANAGEWQEGVFLLVRLSPDGNERKLPWSSLSLDMHDWKKYINEKSAKATEVSENNIASVGERRERRSRASEVAVRAAAEAEVSTPIRRRRAGASSTPSGPPSATPAKTASATLDSPARRPGRPPRKQLAAESNSSFEKEVKSPAAVAPAPVLTKEEKTEDGRSTRIFLGKTFILTSANRTGPEEGVTFRKNEMKKSILERGGVVVDDISAVAVDADAFLISDTHYRTHKYLAAMARAMPCVSHKWVVECVRQEKLLDHEPFLLAGGQALLDGNIYPLPKEKGVLLANKRVMVHSRNEPGNKKSMSFTQIWEPIVEMLGASVVKAGEDVNATDVDILLTDSSASASLVSRVQAEKVAVVSSEWLIQAIIMSKCPDFNAHPRFRYDCGNEAKSVQ